MIAATLRGLGATDLEVLVGTSSATMTQGWHGHGVATVASMEVLVASARTAASGARTEGGFTNGLGPVPCASAWPPSAPACCAWPAASLTGWPSTW